MKGRIAFHRSGDLDPKTSTLEYDNPHDMSPAKRDAPFFKAPPPWGYKLLVSSLITHMVVPTCTLDPETLVQTYPDLRSFKEFKLYP